MRTSVFSRNPFHQLFATALLLTALTYSTVAAALYIKPGAGASPDQLVDQSGSPVAGVTIDLTSLSGGPNLTLKTDEGGFIHQPQDEGKNEDEICEDDDDESAQTSTASTDQEDDDTGGCYWARGIPDGEYKARLVDGPTIGNLNISNGTAAWATWATWSTAIRASVGAGGLIAGGLILSSSDSDKNESNGGGSPGTSAPTSTGTGDPSPVTVTPVTGPIVTPTGISYVHVITVTNCPQDIATLVIKNPNSKPMNVTLGSRQPVRINGSFSFQGTIPANSEIRVTVKFDCSQTSDVSTSITIASSVSGQDFNNSVPVNGDLRNP